MAKPNSPLVAAAAAFDEELAVYSRLGELFLKTPLNTLKHLERANQTLQELADSEQRLQAAGKQLIEALTAARQVQETLSQQVIDAAPALKDRNVKLGELKAAMGKLATDVGNLNTVVSGGNGDSGGEPAKPDPGEVSAIVLGLSDRAQELANSCREAEFSELADDAHALYQRLKAVGTKLQKAGGN